MNKVMMIVTSVSLAATLLAGPTHAAFPALTKIYRFTGIVNKPTPPVGDYPAQTAIQCTNWSPNAARIQIITYDGDTGATLTGPVYPLAHLRTITVVTSHIIIAGNPYSQAEDQNMQMGLLRDGSMEIRATAPQVHCDVKQVWYWLTQQPNIVSLVIHSLHGVRFNQEAGAQE